MPMIVAVHINTKQGHVYSFKDIEWDKEFVQGSWGFTVSTIGNGLEKRQFFPYQSIETVEMFRRVEDERF